ncbi:MAG TPA: 3-oxoacyl-[acyl-carrier-protein] synthase III C-terminal domain-containing protein [Acidimicrobiales bacterium]|nr:3-oxoacyl-[acyl-carrier-protein] synthase III C-terminal domain-containing protein [Acidimicrobiales bacterium]
MGTTIEGIAVVGAGWRNRRRALRLAVAATGAALEDAHLKPAAVDLLINAGIYHDRNLGEPALAPLIQADSGMNAGDPTPGRIGTFSFDIANGGSGVLTALRIADGFLRSRTVTTVVAVAGDADPGFGLADDFPFEPAAGAIVCRWTDSERGLASFRWHNRPDDGATFRAGIGLRHGRNVLSIGEDPGFAEQAAETAVVPAREVLREHRLGADDIDLMVCSPGAPAFTKKIAMELALPDDRIVAAGPELHTAAFIVALAAARQQGRLSEAANVLFVCGAAGLTAGAALYRP